MQYKQFAAGVLSAAMLFSQAVPAVAAADDEVLHLSFDDESCQDSSSAQNNAIPSSISYVSGILGKGARIQNANGNSSQTVSSFIEIPETLQLETSDVTFSFWFKTETGTEEGGCVIGNKDYASGANDGFIVGNFSTNIRSNFAFNRTRKDTTFGQVDGQWHHLAVVLDRDGNMSSYEDGVLKGSQDISQFKDISLDVNTLRIGADGVGTYGLLDAVIDEVQIFKSAKTASEIQSLYQSVKDQIDNEDLTDVVVLDASFDGNTQDSSGRANHGDAIGDPEYVLGVYGQALHIVNTNGSSSATAQQYVDFGNNSDLKFGTDDFTIRYWARSDNGVSDGGALISNKNYNSGGNTGFAIGNFDNGFRANFRADGQSRKDIYGIAPIDGKWHYMEIQFDRDGSITAYRDGIQAGSTSIAADAGKSIDAGHFVVGADGYFAWGLNDAYIDELTVVRGITDVSNSREVYGQGIVHYATTWAAQLLADAQVYAPNDPSLIDVAQDALTTLENTDEEDLEALISSAQSLVDALEALDASMPDYDPSLVLYASFDDENANDESGRNHAVTVAGNPEYVEGISGKAIHLTNANGGTTQVASQYVDFGNAADLNFGSDSFSFEFWYKELADNQECSLLGNKNWDSGANIGWNLGIVGSGLQLNFTPASSSRKDIRPGFVEDSSWHHLAASVDRDGSLVFYKDGARAGSSDIRSLSGKSIDALNLVLGADALYRYGLNDALIDELKVYNRTLTDEEVAQAASAGALENALQEAAALLETADASQTRKEALANSITTIRERRTEGYGLDELSTSLSLALEAFNDEAADPIISFNVLSDVHVGDSDKVAQNANLIDALNDLEFLNPNSVANVFPGDLTDGGSEGQFNAFYSILERYSAAWPIPALGNHDVRWLCSSSDRNEAALRIPTCVEGTSPFKERYLSRNQQYMPDTPEGQLYYDQWIDGYHFITLNTEKDLKDQAYLSDEQISWLADILEGSDPDQPIFIQIHQTFQGTADHEELDWIGEDSEENLKAVLRNYPQSIIFTGHVHNGKNLIDVYNRDFGHVVDVPCFYYSSYGDSQNRIAYQVDVYEDDVVIRLRDFANDTWLEDYTWHVDLDAVDLIDDSLDLPVEQMTITAGSEHSTSGSEGPASNLLDGNTSTIWHTSYSGNGTTMDQRWLEVELDTSTWIQAVRYLPRQAGSNGTILKADVYTSNDAGQTWTYAASAKWTGSAVWKAVSFTPVLANAVRIVPTETIGEYASGAELRIARADLDLAGQLGVLIEQAEGLDLSLYTAASAALVTSALNQAREVVENEDASDGDLLQAIEQLQAALSSLEKINTIRIASYNIAAGRKPDLTAINNQMAGLDIDIAGLQEIDMNNGRNNFDMLQRISDLGDYPWNMFQKAIDYSNGEYGIGIVSAYEILEESGASYVASIGENRVWQRTLIEKDGKQIALYNTHMSYENTEIRKAQMLELIAVVNADPVEYKAITGDFNADQFHEEFFPFLESFNMANGWNTQWYETYNLYDATMKVYSIDNIITTRNLKLTAMDVVENSLSDHNMIWAEFQFLDEELPSDQLLQFVLKDAKAIEDEGYSASSWNNLQQVIARAQDTSNMSQEEIDVLVAELQQAMNSLEVYKDKTLLQMAVDYANAIDESALTHVNALVIANFEDALAYAQSVLDDEQATQTTIDAAWVRLTQAIHMLDFTADSTTLQELINQALLLQEEDFTPESWQELQAALEQAQETLERPTALDASMQEACDRLLAAMNGLVTRDFDLSLLLYLIQATQSLDRTLYVADSTLDAFEAALEQAQSVAQSPESQQQINDAVQTLHSAWLNLRMKPDESLLAILNDQLAQAKAFDTAFFSESETAQLQTWIGKAENALGSDLTCAKDVELLIDEFNQMRAWLNKTETPVSTTDRLQSAGETVSTNHVSAVQTAYSSSAKVFALCAMAAGTSLLAWRKKRKIEK